MSFPCVHCLQSAAALTALTIFTSAEPETQDSIPLAVSILPFFHSNNHSSPWFFFLIISAPLLYACCHCLVCPLSLLVWKSAEGSFQGVPSVPCPLVSLGQLHQEESTQKLLELTPNQGNCNKQPCRNPAEEETVPFGQRHLCPQSVSGSFHMQKKNLLSRSRSCDSNLSNLECCSDPISEWQ